MYPKFLWLAFYGLMSFRFLCRLIGTHRYFTGDTGGGGDAFRHYLYLLSYSAVSRPTALVVSFNRAHKSTKAEPADNNLSLGVFIINFLARS